MDPVLKTLLRDNISIEDYLKLLPKRASKTHLVIESLAIINNLLKSGTTAKADVELAYQSLTLQSAAADVNIPKLYKRRTERILVHMINQLIAMEAFKKGGYIAELDYFNESGYGYKFDGADWFASVEIDERDKLKSFAIISTGTATRLSTGTPLTYESVVPLQKWLEPDIKKMLRKMNINL